MGYEMVNDKLVITPHRIHSLLRLIHQCTDTPRDQLLGLLQPASLTNNREAAAKIYAVANRYRFIDETETKDRRARLGVPVEDITSEEDFRELMQRTLLGATQENDDNYVLNLFTAWYAVQDEKVFEYSKADFERKFHEHLYPGVAVRVISEQPGLSGWRTWAEFLGWGWKMQFSRREEMQIVPDATVRLRPLLPMLLPVDGGELPFGQFAAALGDRCPELDGGVLFERCWRASRPHEPRGKSLSLMVSTALRVLHKLGEIELTYQADAPETWRLFPAQSHLVAVSHIRKGRPE
jgi:hypothetical protein